MCCGLPCASAWFPPQQQHRARCRSPQCPVNSSESAAVVAAAAAAARVTHKIPQKRHRATNRGRLLRLCGRGACLRLGRGRPGTTQRRPRSLELRLPRQQGPRAACCCGVHCGSAGQRSDPPATHPGVLLSGRRALRRRGIRRRTRLRGVHRRRHCCARAAPRLRHAPARPSSLHPTQHAYQQ
jgi:hypothetical protein